MQLRTLEFCTLAECTQAFNLSFSDYIVPLQLTEDAFKEKMKTENIKPTLSAGAFVEEQLVGFILHGHDLIDGIPTVYNAGTGVIPEHRGKSITTSLYQFILPKLKMEGIHQHVLEVISTNSPAIKVYEKLGFKKHRELGVYKSTKPVDTRANILIKETGPAADLLRSFGSCSPSWQNNISSINRNSEGHLFLAAFQDNEPVGCVVFVPKSGRVKQLAIHPHHRRQGIGTALLSYIMNINSDQPIVFTNVDLEYVPAISFLNHLGFKQLVTQYEMKASF